MYTVDLWNFCICRIPRYATRVTEMCSIEQRFLLLNTGFHNAMPWLLLVPWMTLEVILASNFLVIIWSDHTIKTFFVGLKIFNKHFLTWWHLMRSCDDMHITVLIVQKCYCFTCYLEKIYTVHKVKICCCSLVATEVWHPWVSAGICSWRIFPPKVHRPWLWERCPPWLRLLWERLHTQTRRCRHEDHYHRWKRLQTERERQAQSTEKDHK